MNPRAPHQPEHMAGLLSPYLDGDLPPAEMDRVRGHLDSCLSCREELEYLRAMALTCRGLDRPEPPVSLWPAIQQELQRKEMVMARFRLFGVGAFAGAAVMVVLVFGVRPRIVNDAMLAQTAARDQGGGASGPADPWLAEAEGEFRRARETYERSIQKLSALLVREQDSWPAESRARFAMQVQQLDDLIARSRRAAGASSGDTAGHEILVSAYRRKLEFLMAAVHGDREQDAPPASFASFGSFGRPAFGRPSFGSSRGMPILQPASATVGRSFDGNWVSGGGN